jgi:solute carrier family 25 protein 44
MAGRRIEWDDIDKARFYLFGPFIFAGVRAAVYPPSVVKTRMQLQSSSVAYRSAWHAFRSIVRAEGASALYRGFGTNVWSILSGQAYITVFEVSRGALSRSGALQSDSARFFAAGAVASFVGQMILVPLDVVSQRLMVQGGPRAFKGGAQLARHIVASEGVRGLYRGFAASVATYAPTSGVWWTCYDVYRSLAAAAVLGEAGQDPQSALASTAELMLVEMLSGGAAGCTAAVATNPLDVLRTRVQVNGAQGATWFGTLTSLAREEGWRAFWRGASARAATMAPSSMLTVIAYESLKRLSKRSE